MSFFDDVSYYAEKSSRALNIPKEVILAQWSVESARGESNLARRGNNLGGIKYTKNSIAEGRIGNFASYKDLNQFTQDYIRVMSLGYYDEVRAAGGIEDTVEALANSPYDAGHYGGDGASLLNVIKKNISPSLPEYSLSNEKFDYKEVGGDIDKENIIGKVFTQSPEDWAKENPAALAGLGEGIGNFFEKWIILLVLMFGLGFALFKTIK